MNHNSSKKVLFKEMEKELSQRLQDYFHVVLRRILEDVDVWLMENRDHDRYQNKEKRATSMDTVFGPVSINRRKYKDRDKDVRVTLLDQYHQFQGDDSLSPYLAELAVDWAVRGSSYRDVRDRMQQLLGYQAMSHEQIRQKVQQVQEVDHAVDEEKREKADALFLEIDGIHALLQNEKKNSRDQAASFREKIWGSGSYSLYAQSGPDTRKLGEVRDRQDPTGRTRKAD